MVGASIANLIATYFSYLKSRDAARDAAAARVSSHRNTIATDAIDSRMTHASGQIAELQGTVNGRLAELIETIREAAFARGVLKGIRDTQNRDFANPAPAEPPAAGPEPPSDPGARPP